MNLSLAKSGSLLGPPRNAMLWMRAKEMAQASGRPDDFQTTLQLYQMLTLAPGFPAVSKSKSGASGIDWSPPQGVRDACKRGLEHREKHGGSGLTANAVRWATKLARGDDITPQRAKTMHAFHARHAVDKKPNWHVDKTPGWVASAIWGGDSGKSWAAKLRRQMNKAVPALDAGLRINAGNRFDADLSSLTTSQGIVDGNIPKPSRQSASVADIVHGLPLSADDAGLLQADLEEVLEQAQQPADAMEQAAAACAYHPALTGALTQDVGARMAYLSAHYLRAQKGQKMRLSLSKAKYTSRKQVGDHYVYTYANDGSKPSDHLGTTQSGKRIQHSDAAAYHSVHQASFGKMHEAVKKEFPGYSAQDHADAAAAHRKDNNTGRRLSHAIANAHAEVAGSMGHKPKHTEKSMATKKIMKKANELEGITFSEGALKTGSGETVTPDGNSLTELQSLLADYDAAGVGGTQGARAVQLVTDPSPGSSGVDAQPLSPPPDKVELDGNAPRLPFGQTIEVRKSHEDSAPLGGLGGTLQFFLGRPTLH